MMGQIKFITSLPQDDLIVEKQFVKGFVGAETDGDLK